MSNGSKREGDPAQFEAAIRALLENEADSTDEPVKPGGFVNHVDELVFGVPTTPTLINSDFLAVTQEELEKPETDD